MPTKRAYRRAQESTVGAEQFQYRVTFGRRPLALAARQVRKLHSERRTLTERLLVIAAAINITITVWKARTHVRRL